MCGDGDCEDVQRPPARQRGADVHVQPGQPRRTSHVRAAHLPGRGLPGAPTRGLTPAARRAGDQRQRLLRHPLSERVQQEYRKRHSKPTHYSSTRNIHKEKIVNLTSVLMLLLYCPIKKKMVHCCLLHR